MKIKPEVINYRKYHIPSCPAYMRRPKNAVYYSAANSIKHEISKAVAALMLHKWGDIRFGGAVTKHIEILAASIDLTMQSFPKQKADYITEACPNGKTDRRVDLVRLRDDVRYEFECNSKVKKEGINTITIYI